MFDGFEVWGGQIHPDLLDFSYPLYFPVSLKVYLQSITSLWDAHGSLSWDFQGIVSAHKLRHARAAGVDWVDPLTPLDPSNK
jgi:hypothetical protein